MLLSLHQNPNCLRITSLDDLCLIQKIPLMFLASRMEIDYTCHQVYITCHSEKEADFIIVPLKFKMEVQSDQKELKAMTILH